MKNRKHHSIPLLLISLLLLGMTGCTAVEMDNQQENDSQEVSLVLSTQSEASPTRSGVSDSYVGTLRVIVFEVTGNDNNPTYVRQIQNEIHSGVTSQVKVGFKKCDKVRVFLIANERPEWKLNDSSKSAQELKDFTVSYSALNNQNIDITAPLSMFGESQTVSGQVNGNAAIELVRNVARIDLGLTCETKDITKYVPGFKLGDELKINTVRIAGMAPATGLANAKENPGFAPDSYLTSVTKDVTGYQITYDDFKNFLGFIITGVSFYVPEHYVTNTNYHTYIVISGEYIPKNSTKGIPVEYTLPVGRMITQAKIDNNTLNTSDLTLERNWVYQMNASFKSLQQISEVHVKVKDWEEKPVDGSINDGQFYLNISDLNPKVNLNGTSTLVQFWSNLPAEKIQVLPIGKIKETGKSFNVNDIFVSLTGEKATNLIIKGDASKGEQWGHLSLAFQQNSNVTIDKTYTITLAAGGIERTIDILATETSNTKIDNL